MLRPADPAVVPLGSGADCFSDYGGVGVGGLATAGGMGWFARSHGLTIDLLRAVDIVLADGSLVHASAHQNEDLFWAVRGAGANFGIAVAFEFEAHPVGSIGFAQLVFDASDTAEFLQRWGAATESADRSVTGEVMLGGGPGPRQATAMIVVDSDDPNTVVERLQQIASIAPLVHQSASVTTYDALMGSIEGGEQQGSGEPLVHSGLATHLTRALTLGLTEMLDAGDAFVLAIRSAGGAVSDVPAEATAYAWRDANFSIVAFGTRSRGLDARWPALTEHMAGMYLSFETATGAETVAQAFPPAHLARLRRLKQRYDATSLFRDNFYIDPEGLVEPAA